MIYSSSMHDNESAEYFQSLHFVTKDASRRAVSGATACNGYVNK